jgi:hypothetical protein
MHQDIVLSGIPPHVRARREVAYAHEESARYRAGASCLFLRKTSTGASSSINVCNSPLTSLFSKAEQSEARAAWLRTREVAEGVDGGAHGEASTSKMARAHAKTYTLGPPLVPYVIYDNVLQYTHGLKVHKQPDFIQLLCRYWSLKREARRGAPLLKRLHLEPWTASNVSKQQTDEEKELKLKVCLYAPDAVIFSSQSMFSPQHAKALRQDLENVRMLAELCKKREKAKQEQIEAIDGLMTSVFYPHIVKLREAFELITLYALSPLPPR